MPSVTIAQLTDCHILAPGKALFGRIDTGARLAATVAFLNAMSPRPHAVVLTGDLVDRGAPEEYQHLRRLLQPLAMPYYLLPGNHDRRDALRAAFPDHAYLPRDGFLNWAVDDYDIRLIGLDTLVEGQPLGNLCYERIAWLDAALAGRADRPTLVFMHHPPFLTGIEQFDAMGCMGADRLALLVDRNPQIEAILCGHHHQSLVTRWNGVTAMVAPSTAHQLAFGDNSDDHPASSPPWELTSPAVTLHVWRRGGGLMSRIALADTLSSGGGAPDKVLRDAA